MEQQTSIPTSTSTLDVARERAQAVKMLRDRAVDGAEDLVTHTPPSVIVRTCQWWDRQRDAGPALLVWKIKQGGVDTNLSPEPERKKTPTYNHEALPARFMEHSEWLARRGYPTDECPTGYLLIVEAVYPILTVECDTCGFLAGLPHRNLGLAKDANLLTMEA